MSNSVLLVEYRVNGGGARVRVRRVRISDRVKVRLVIITHRLIAHRILIPINCVFPCLICLHFDTDLCRLQLNYHCPHCLHCLNCLHRSRN